MDGLFFLMSIVAVGLVMWWAVQNDRVGIGRPTGGLFAMPPRGRVKARSARTWRNPAASEPETKSSRSMPP